MTLFVGVILLPLPGFPVALAAEARSREEIRIPREQDGGLQIDAGAGSIVIRGVGADTIACLGEFTATGATRAAARDRLKKARMVVKRKGDELLISVRSPAGELSWLQRMSCLLRGELGKDLKSALTLKVPSTMKLGIAMTSGEVDVEGMDGPVCVDATAGAVRIVGGRSAAVDVTSAAVFIADVQGPVKVDGTSGSVEVRRCSGMVRIDLTSGDVFAEDLTGGVYIDGISGNAQLRAIRSDVRFDATGGDLEILDFLGSLDVDTFSGDLWARGSVQQGGHIRVHTLSGDVHLVLDRPPAAALKLQSDAGRIDPGQFGDHLRADDERHFSGTYGHSEPVQIHLQTGSGDITLAGR